MFRSETQIPISIPAGETLAVNLMMKNAEAGEFEQPATLYLEVEGQLIEKTVVLKGSATNRMEQGVSSGGEKGTDD